MAVAVADAASADEGADVVVASLDEAATEEVSTGAEADEAPPEGLKVTSRPQFSAAD